MANRSLQQKLMRVIVVTSTTILLLTCVVYFAYEYLTFKQTTRQHLMTLGEIIASNNTAALAFDDRNSAAEILDALKAEKHIVAACIYDTNGRLFSKFPRTLSDINFPLTVPATGYHFTDSYLEGFQPIIQGDNRLGTLYLKSDLKAINARFIVYGLLALLVVIVFILFAYLLSRQLQKSVIKPILDLAQTATVISSQGDYSVRAKMSTDYEAGVLTTAFNQMLDQIQSQNKEIISFNQQLEQKIKERTAELEDSNEVLRKQNEFVEKIIDSSVDLIAVFDKQLNYVTINRQAYMSYQVKREDIVGKNVVDLFPEVKQSGMLDDLQRAIAGEMVYTPKYRSPVLGRYFENFYIPLKDDAGSVYRILTIAHDITFIMESNEKLQSVNEELQKSNQSLEQFAYVASHDLQEPLRKIQTFSELSEKNLDHPDILKRYLGKINSSARRMSDLVKAILNFSRLSKVDQEYEAINLNQLVENIGVDLELVIAEKEGVIKAGDLPVIKGIAMQISQLFFNLISNSLKFSERPPIIEITGGVVPSRDKKLLGLAEDEPWVKLMVRDNGIGFDQQYAEKIFTIFQRLHTIRDYNGTGIGLALCKKIVENHEGKIMVESQPGEGTVFRIFLPVR